jgi:hypothetical protein
MSTELGAEIKDALHALVAQPSLQNARVLEGALVAAFQKRVFGRINQKASIEAASESDRGVTERLANAFGGRRSAVGSNRCGYSEERRGDRCSIWVATFVLGGEQLFQFLLQIGGSAAFFRSFKSIHGWAVVFPELVYER